jgi:cell division protein FtsI/penicillin-binding protein 2
MSRRMKFLMGLICLVGVTILFQIVRIQNNASAKKWVTDTADKRTHLEVMVEPERGIIYDRWGSLLAGNTKIYEINIALNELTSKTNRETIARDLSSVLGEKYTYEWILAQISPEVEETDRQNVYIGTGFTQEQIDQLETKQDAYENLPLPKKNQVNPTLRGVYWTPTLKRVYPENRLASNILGFYYGGDPETPAGGLGGVEQYYNSRLAGTPRTITVVANPNEAVETPEVPPGASLVLTIDREIQAMAEDVLDRAVEHNGAQGGVIVIMDPRNGEILAMATTPRLDPNNYGEYASLFGEDGVMTPAVSEIYEPGSVFKVITMASAIDAGVVTPDTPFLDTGVYMVDGIPIYNWDRGAWGPQTMTTCMQHSLNVCLSWVADQLTPSRFYEYMQRFGIDHRTGIDLADERIWPLSLPGDRFWTHLSLANNSFGQGVAATPIQMVTAISALANDGVMMAPHVMKSYMQDGRPYNFDLIPLGSPISAETAHTVTEMLAASLEEEASNALVEGYRVAGKTGTAEISEEGIGYATNMTNASFVGWGPVDDPRFVVYVWLKKPTSSPWGSVVAAPVFSEVVQKLVIYLGLPPDEVRHQLFNE